MNTTAPNAEDLLSLTADIVSSHVSNNTVAVSDMPGLIEQVYGALSKLAAPSPQPEPRPEPAVPVRRSVTPDHVICLEDGKKLKMLKRHLKTQYNMTPEEYRERWGLPADYPMVAPNYAEQRRKLAKKIGLGTGRRKR
ncbi:MAG: MucR family transcriptional regulator [Pseudomonadota bacterium]